MLKINNKTYENEKAIFKIATQHTKKQIIKVIDLFISYEEADTVKNHHFEGIEQLEYLKALKVGQEIKRKGISDYLCFENNDLEEKGMDLSYKNNIDSFEDVFVKSRKIDENKILIEIKIAKLNLLCEEIFEIPLKNQ